jgi:hypothetical protein
MVTWLQQIPEYNSFLSAFHYMHTCVIVILNFETAANHMLAQKSNLLNWKPWYRGIQKRAWCYDSFVRYCCIRSCALQYGLIAKRS